jgi:hypothetical protein
MSRVISTLCLFALLPRGLHCRNPLAFCVAGALGVAGGGGRLPCQSSGIHICRRRCACAVDMSQRTAGNWSPISSFKGWRKPGIEPPGVGCRCHRRCLKACWLLLPLFAHVTSSRMTRRCGPRLRIPVLPKTRPSRSMPFAAISGSSSWCDSPEISPVTQTKTEKPWTIVLRKSFRSDC